MSDSEHSTVTYTSVSIPVEDDSDIGSPGVDGPPIMPEDPYAYIMAAYGVPPSPDYIPGPEVPPSPDYILGPKGPPSPDYVPGPEEPEQAPHSPVYLHYVPEPVYPEYIPPEDDIFLAEEQLLHAATSPNAESPGYIPESDPEEDPEEDLPDYPADRDDDDDEDEDEDEEEEEHPAPADFVPPVHRMTAMISIRDEPSISLPPREEFEKLLALTTPPPSPLTPLSSPLPQIPSPPLPIPSPPPNILTHIEIPESCLPLRKRVRFTSPTPSREVGESSAAGAARCSTSRELDYDITDTWDDLEETTSMYGIIEDAQDDRSQLRGRVNLLYRDKPVHRRLAVMIEREAKMAHEAWGLSMDASDYARSYVMSLHTMVVAQSALISELQSADHRRQRVISELLASDHKRQMVEFQRQHGPAKGPAQPDAPGEAGSRVPRFGYVVAMLCSLAFQEGLPKIEDLQQPGYQAGNEPRLRQRCIRGQCKGHKPGQQRRHGYVGPFKVLKKVGAVAYKLELPQELSRVHNTFHVSNLKKCYSDDPLVVPLEGLQVDDKLHFVEEPVEVMDREVKQLSRSRVPIVKVRWNSRRGPEFTWEREDQFRKKYPHLFTKTASSSSVVS
ncbi:hypothetical protein Tco_1406144 [Tanacetum coccineum]